MQRSRTRFVRLAAAAAVTGCLPAGGGHMGGMMRGGAMPQDSVMAMPPAREACPTVIKERTEGTWRVTLTLPWAAPTDSLLYFVDVHATGTDTSASGARVTLVVRSESDAPITPAFQSTITTPRTDGRYPFAPSLLRRGRYRAVVTVADTARRTNTATVEQEIVFDGCGRPMPPPKRLSRAPAALSWIGVGALIMGIMMLRGIR